MIQIFSVLRVLLLITVNMDHPAIHYSNPPLNNIIHDSKLIKLSDYEKSDWIITYGIIHLFTVYSVFIRTFVSLNYWHHETSIQNDFHKSLKLFCCSLMKKSYYLIIILHRVLQYMAMAHRFERGLSVVALNIYSAISLPISGLFLIPSLLICDKLFNEWCSVFMGKIINCQKSWRTFVCTDISSNCWRFELMSSQTNVLALFKAECIHFFSVAELN